MKLTSKQTFNLKYVNLDLCIPLLYVSYSVINIPLIETSFPDTLNYLLKHQWTHFFQCAPLGLLISKTLKTMVSCTQNTTNQISKTVVSICANMHVHTYTFFPPKTLKPLLLGKDSSHPTSMHLSFMLLLAWQKIDKRLLLLLLPILNCLTTPDWPGFMYGGSQSFLVSQACASDGRVVIILRSSRKPTCTVGST